ncbi:putative carbonic anhydrase 5 [Scylla paramamosain]
MANLSLSERPGGRKRRSGFRAENTMIPTLVMLSFILVVSGVAATHYDYENQDKWGGSCNTGEKQSPLNFRTVFPSSFPPLIFKNYGLINITLEIDDHHLKANLVPLSPNRPHLLGGGLNGKYVLDSFHFHWGKNNEEGSEHRLLNCNFAGEMHFVHYNQKYRDVTEASNNTDGLAVLAVWLEAAVDDTEDDGESLLDDNNDASSDNDHAASTNFWLHMLVPNRPFVNHIPRQTFLRHLFPQNTRSFYKYKGSLTTPLCSETVVWTVFRDPVVAPRRLLYFLRSLRSPPGHGRLISRNFRDIQHQGNRRVYFSDISDRHFAQCSNEVLRK